MDGCEVVTQHFSDFTDCWTLVWQRTFDYLEIFRRGHLHQGSTIYGQSHEGVKKECFKRFSLVRTLTPLLSIVPMLFRGIERRKNMRPVVKSAPEQQGIEG